MKFNLFYILKFQFSTNDNNFKNFQRNANVKHVLDAELLISFELENVKRRNIKNARLFTFLLRKIIIKKLSGLEGFLI